MDIATNLFYNENTVHGGGILSAFSGVENSPKRQKGNYAYSNEKIVKTRNISIVSSICADSVYKQE